MVTPENPENGDEPTVDKEKMDELLRRMLKTPPKPHKHKPKPDDARSPPLPKGDKDDKDDKHE